MGTGQVKLREYTKVPILINSDAPTTVSHILNNKHCKQKSNVKVSKNGNIAKNKDGGFHVKKE